MIPDFESIADQDQIHDWVVLLKTNIHLLIEDTSTLGNAASDSKLSTRADAAR